MDIEEAVRRRFVVCHTQGMAMERQEQRKEARIFSFESPKYNAGCRKFIAAELDRFWQWYRDARVPRHFYEIIEEGRPCRPYFDLEFAKDLNPELDPGEALRDFLALCRDAFAELDVVLTDSHFLVLESSSDKKFSVHVVIHLPGKRLLPDNIAMKPFVERMRARMQETGRGVVRAAKGDGFICDHTVYTKNRNFRLYLSSKCGKDATLRLSRSCRFYGDRTPKKADIFFDSLVVPKDWDSAEYEILDLSAIQQQQPIRAVAPAQPMQRETRRMVGTFSLRCNEQVEELAKCTGPSPFPVLDAFMLDFLRQFTPSVGIRQWTLYIYRPKDSRSVQYELSKCRYCLNIGREHKRQNVMWKVDLEQFNFFQMCFDVADCPDFVSDIFDLPIGIQGKLRPLIDPVFAKHPRRTTPTAQPSSKPDAVAPNDFLGDAQSLPARIKREEQSDSDVEVLAVNPGSSRCVARESAYVKRPRRTPATKPLSSTPVVAPLDDSFGDLQISHETPDALSVRSQTPL